MLQDEGIAGVVRWLRKNRGRLLFLLLLLLIASCVCYVFSDPLVRLLLAITPGLELYFLSPAEGLIVRMQTAFLFGLLFSLPFLLYFIAAFFSGKIHGSRRFMLFGVFLPAALCLFYGGLWFGACVVLPPAMKFFLSCGMGILKPMISGASYVSFVMFFSLALGLMFELPLVMLFLARLGWVNYEMLSRQRKTAILVIFIVLAVLTPTPDAFTLLITGVPLAALYELSVWLTFFFRKSRRKDETASETVV